ncbi:MAG: hypothetical protein M3N54_01255 [Acidobacteriota bacterium]|nr:hypothetical protein [Acidobacteriota bacterium]
MSFEKHPGRTSWLRQLAILLLFGTAFGYLESAVVSYLRILHEPARRHYYPDRPPEELFPLLTLQQVRAAPEQRKTLFVEIGREAATMLMLAAIAWAVAGNARQWLAAFAIAFGIWDIVFYACLKLILGWPASLFTWDILFLIPVPWVGPVIAPVLVSVAMITAGTWSLWREAAGRPLRLRMLNVAGVISGALVIILAFTLDYRNIMAGGMPRPFHWGVFGLGLGIGAASYGRAA